jgi:CRISPR-associated protein Cmr6
VPFLVVEAGQTFLFGVIPRRQNEEGRADCEQVKAWLNEALAWLGAGAKTAVGYGRFALDDKAQQALVRQQEAQQVAEQQRQELDRLAQEHSPLYLELYQASLVGNWREDKNAFSQAGVIETWLDKLEADPQSDAVELMYELIAIHYREVLDNPDATEGKKQKPKFKDRQRNFAKRILKLRAGP